MNLLLRRSQAQGVTGRPMFNLWAKADLLPEEEALLAKYREVRNTVLLDGDPTKGLRPALYLALPIAAVAALIVAPEFGLWPAALVFLVAFFGGAYVIYEHLREPVYVRDLLNGRYFRCRSVTELMDKEDVLKLMAVNLRQLLEDMKDWGGKEVIAIAPRRARSVPEVVTTEVEHWLERPLRAAE